MNNFLFTSESVSEGHPDKLADQISDAILDAYLELDPNAKVACECLITTGQLVIAGEVSSIATVDVIQIAKDTIRDIGYTSESVGFDCDTANYLNLLHAQSPEINHSVVDGGAGDQGLMFGYACTETETLMPLPITMAHEILWELKKLRKSGYYNWLMPDAKCQVTVEYKNNTPIRVHTIVLSTQHTDEVDKEYIEPMLIQYLLKKVLTKYFPDSYLHPPIVMINPSGSFTIGGPHGDTGLTGRKIIVDSYGGSCPHGGGAFSGKDPSKVDRSAAYAARYVAKHIVVAKLATKCTVQISYAIGYNKPISLYIDTHGTGVIFDEIIVDKISKIFDLTPNGIIKMLDLKRPIYKETASYGHFGIKHFPWEVINDDIIKKIKNF